MKVDFGGSRPFPRATSLARTVGRFLGTPRSASIWNTAAAGSKLRGAGRRCTDLCFETRSDQVKIGERDASSERCAQA